MPLVDHHQQPAPVHLGSAFAALRLDHGMDEKVGSKPLPTVSANRATSPNGMVRPCSCPASEARWTRGRF